MRDSVICAVQRGSKWQTRVCSRGFLGWRLGEQRVVNGYTVSELLSRLASEGHRGVVAIAVDRENLLLRLHEETDRCTSLFPADEKLVYWSRKAVTDGVRRTETVGLRSRDVMDLQAEAQRAGFSRCVLFPTWIGSIVGSTGAKPGTVLEFHSGFLRRAESGWSQWQLGPGHEAGHPSTVIFGVEAALLGGLLLAIENSVPPGWSSSLRARRSRVRWLTAAGLVAALLIAFAGRWHWIERQIASEKAVLEGLRAVHQERTERHGCTLSNLRETFQMINQAAQREVTATTLAYSSSDGLSLSGIGSSPSHIRSFLEAAGITENTISFTGRDRDIYFQMEATISCDQ